ncbi:MAG: sterol desaturase family protein, partial [Myxococcales bacterium]|nr:sterol desaturase family protein [Myxococcales bacterium]
MDLVVRLLSFTALAGLAFIPVERLYGARRGPRRDRLTDAGFATVGEWLAQLGVAVVVGGLLAGLDDVAREEPLWIGIADPALRTGLEIASGLLVFEIMGYAYHRAAHRVPVLWRLHAVHHSAEQLDWLASFRQHPLEIVLMTLVQNAPLVLLGIPLGAHVMVLLVIRLGTVFVHADLRVPEGWWTRVVATPGFHHRHHQRDGAVRNYASLFP